MKKVIVASFGLAVVAFLSGCLSPVKNEIPLVSGLAAKSSSTNETKVLLFNDSNQALYGLDGSGRINVWIDGKGVALINVAQYTQVILPKGRHQLDLKHLDIVPFRSKHSLELFEAQIYVKIYATAAGNEIKVVPVLPLDFEQDFTPVKLKK